jgi:cell division protein FtsA
MQPSQKYKVSIDIGSTKIAGIVYKIERNGKIKISSKQILNSQGFRYGNIVNMEDAENCLMNLIYLLETESKSSISSINVSVSGCNAKSYYVDQTININNSVTQEDINNLTNLALKKFNIAEYKIIHYFAIEFTVDNSIVENPLNIYCRELGCKFHLVVAQKQKLKNIEDCLAKCNVKIEKFIYSTYASGLACLSEDAREIGSIIFELGSHNTSFAIFLNKRLTYVNSIPFGSHNITLDISKALEINVGLAEKIKIMYGKVKPGNLVNQLINFSNFDKKIKDEIDLNLTIGDLSQIITPRADEIIEMIKSKYDELDISHLISKNIYITGGAANLDGIESAFREHFRYVVTRLKPKLENDLTKLIFDYQDSTIIGMALCSNDNEKKTMTRSMLQKFLNWLKNNI